MWCSRDIKSTSNITVHNKIVELVLVLKKFSLTKILFEATAGFAVLHNDIGLHNFLIFPKDGKNTSQKIGEIRKFYSITSVTLVQKM